MSTVESNDSLADTEPVDCLIWTQKLIRELQQALDPFVAMCLEKYYGRTWRDKAVEVANRRWDSKKNCYVPVDEHNKVSDWAGTVRTNVAANSSSMIC